MFKLRHISLGLALAAVPISASAQAREGTTTPLASASRLQTSIVMDGRLDEAAWAEATPITEFRQYEPEEGAPASLRTELRVMYDDQALYVGAWMEQPEGVVAPLARRDQLNDADGNNGSFNSLTTDKLVVVLDPYHNHLDEISFEVNPAGVRGESYNGDSSWDPIWQAAAEQTPEGWTAEMRIPLSQLRFSPEETDTWGLQVWRYIDGRNERDMWSFWGQSERGGAMFFGDLQNLAIARQPRQMELLPYVVTGSTLRDVDEANPYESSPDLRLGLGGDLKYLLTSNLTLDATFNPDFGQVEVDPATLNLSAFETYYDEKRPFFVAGASAFRFGRNRCMMCTENFGIGAFYSRRIGRAPQLEGAVGDISTYSDPPENTSILAAAKVTGRTSNGYSIGVMNAVTNEERARYLPETGGGELKQVVEPRANYFVGRVVKEMGGGATTIGGIFTSTIRGTSDSLVSDRLHSHAEAAGIDWFHTWNSRNYSWMGTAIASNVSGSPDAISRTMRSSAHYYQRPDREIGSGGLFNTAWDEDATRLGGYGLYSRVGKDGGGVLRWEAMGSVRSPGLELNDLAYLNRGDYLLGGVNVGGNWTTPTRWYRSVFNSIGVSGKYNFDGDRLGTNVQGFFGMQFNNYWNLRTFMIHETNALDDRLTRGGPLVEGAGYTFGHINVSTDPRKTAVFDIEVEGALGSTEGTHSLTVRPGIALKPMANVFVQLAPSFSYDENVAQYITRVEDPTATAFYGNRYVFGFIEQKTLSLETRINATFTPNLTLELFAQPFLATGDYSHFREFAAPRSIQKNVYGQDVGSVAYDAGAGEYRVDPDGSGPAGSFTFDNPDFTTRSLRGTAVLRWEYRPGSTLFFVWSQERFGEDPFSSFDGGAARSMLLDDPATNVFQIKATYWIG